MVPRSTLRIDGPRRRGPVIRAILSALAVTTAMLAVVAAPARALGTTLYVPNLANPGAVSVVDASTNTVTATIPVGSFPGQTAVTPDGSKVLVTNQGSASVSVIDTGSNTVTATISVASSPTGVVVAPNGTTAYVTSAGGGGLLQTISLTSNTVTATLTLGTGGPQLMALNSAGTKLYVEKQTGSSLFVIDTATNTVAASIPLAATGVSQTWGLSLSPDESKLYVASGYNFDVGVKSAVEVIDTATNTRTATISFGALTGPLGLDVTPDGGKVYVANSSANTVTVIGTATNTITNTIGGFNLPTGVVIPPTGPAYIGDYGTDTVKTVDTATDTITGSITGINNPWFLSESTSSYTFLGFFQPVDDVPALNLVNAGQGIPMKFSLNGDQGLAIINSGYPKATQINCTSGVPVGSDTLTDTAGGSGLSYDTATDTYTYVWKTSKTWKNTCQQFSLGLNDGSTHVANFKFK